METGPFPMMIDNPRARHCQRGTIDWITLAIYAVAALAVAGALYGAWYRQDAAHRELEAQIAAKDARILALEDERAAAQRRAADMAILAARRLADIDRAVKENQERNNEAIASLTARARILQGRLARLLGLRGHKP